MALLFMDPGGEYYFSKGINASNVWTSVSGGMVLSNTSATGRATQFALSGGSGSSAANRSVSNLQGLIAGYALHIGPSTWANGNWLINFIQGGTTGTPQCDVRIDTAGHLFITRNGTVLGTSTNVLSLNNWFYVELKAFIAGGTSGSAEVRVNGVPWVTVTGVNTQATASAFADIVRFNTLSFGAGDSCFLKDLYIVSTSGGAVTSYLGDITVKTCYPNSAGVNQAWTLGAGASQVAAVQDGISGGTVPDDDTSYIVSGTANQISDFAPQSIVAGTILGVIHVNYLRKDDANARQAAPVCISAGTTEQGASITLGSSYAYFYDVIENDPHTAAAWTLSGFNAATFGIKEIT